MTEQHAKRTLKCRTMPMEKNTKFNSAEQKTLRVGGLVASLKTLDVMDV